LAPARATRVVAFDPLAQEAVRAAADGEWAQARFYSASAPGHTLTAMSGMPGEALPLAGELEGVGSLIMVAASAVNAEAIATIGSACQVRGVMTAGLALADGQTPVDALDALVALRPYARILLVPADTDDLIELLRAIRA
jgi:hypothetical protein